MTGCLVYARVRRIRRTQPVAVQWCRGRSECHTSRPRRGEAPNVTPIVFSILQIRELPRGNQVQKSSCRVDQCFLDALMWKAKV